jgi:hypothetical protein
MSDSSDNVEVVVEHAVQAAKEAYASQLTPPSSPNSTSASVDDVFIETLDDEERPEDMHLRKHRVEANFNDVIEKVNEIDNVSISRSPPFPYISNHLPIHKPHAYPCRSTNDPLPAPPSKWPQAPLMMRPSPNSNTKIRGIRYSSSQQYLDFSGFCAGCILPINTGAEAPGKSLVVDFETKLFVGTMLMRIRQAPPAEPANQTSTSYFDGKKRRFQAIIKGRFKQELSMSQCVTGQIFDRPSGKLPAKWIVSSAIRFISALAPQLEATIDGEKPKFLAPLAATAHAVLQYPLEQQGDVYCSDCHPDDTDNLMNYNLYAGAHDLENSVDEPPANSAFSILPEVPSFLVTTTANDKSSVTSRQKTRKRCLNNVTAKKLLEPKFSTQKIYCFEFHQHLLLFGEDLAFDMGRPIGQISLPHALSGQPLKCMAAWNGGDGTKTSGVLEPLWSFDIWHANLYPLAQAYYNSSSSTIQ